jgi:hypothetical protein
MDFAMFNFSACRDLLRWHDSVNTAAIFAGIVADRDASSGPASRPFGSA